MLHSFTITDSYVMSPDVEESHGLQTPGKALLDLDRYEDAEEAANAGITVQAANGSVILPSRLRVMNLVAFT